MLLIYFLQHWSNLSDPGAEDALYETPGLRGFAGWIRAVMLSSASRSQLDYKFMKDFCRDPACSKPP